MKLGPSCLELQTLQEKVTEIKSVENVDMSPPQPKFWNWWLNSYKKKWLCHTSDVWSSHFFPCSYSTTSTETLICGGLMSTFSTLRCIGSPLKKTQPLKKAWKTFDKKILIRSIFPRYSSFFFKWQPFLHTSPVSLPYFPKSWQLYYDQNSEQLINQSFQTASIKFKIGSHYAILIVYLIEGTWKTPTLLILTRWEEIIRDSWSSKNLALYYERLYRW